MYLLSTLLGKVSMSNERVRKIHMYKSDVKTSRRDIRMHYTDLCICWAQSWAKSPYPKSVFARYTLTKKTSECTKETQECAHKTHTQERLFWKDQILQKKTSECTKETSIYWMHTWDTRTRCPHETHAQVGLFCKDLRICKRDLRMYKRDIYIFNARKKYTPKIPTRNTRTKRGSFVRTLECTAYCIWSAVSSLSYRNRSSTSSLGLLYPRSVEKRPRKLRLQIRIKWHSKCSGLYKRCHYTYYSYYWYNSYHTYNLCKYSLLHLECRFFYLESQSTI